MTVILVHGHLHFGHQFPQGEHYPFLQRTIIVSNKDKGNNYQHPEIVPILTFRDLANDPDFKACFLSGQVPEVADEGIAAVQNDIRNHLRDMHETLTKNLVEITKFLLSLGHDVRKADAFIFSEIGNEDNSSIRINTVDDFESVIRNVFSESIIRRWIADAIARSG